MRSVKDPAFAPELAGLTTVDVAIVLFDEACPLCRTLAAYGERRASPRQLRFTSWQAFCHTAEGRQRLGDERCQLAADRLRVLVGVVLLSGEAAWEYLIAKHPDLQALNWLAARTGLQRQMARAAEKTGNFTRLLCARCRR